MPITTPNQNMQNFLSELADLIMGKAQEKDPNLIFEIEYREDSIILNPVHFDPLAIFKSETKAQANERLKKHDELMLITNPNGEKVQSFGCYN